MIDYVFDIMEVKGGRNNKIQTAGLDLHFVVAQFYPPTLYN